MLSGPVGIVSDDFDIRLFMGGASLDLDTRISARYCHHKGSFSRAQTSQVLRPELHSRSLLFDRISSLLNPESFYSVIERCFAFHFTYEGIRIDSAYNSEKSSVLWAEFLQNTHYKFASRP